MEKPYPSISIIGMAGCGKTEIGKRLASIFDFDFFDTDQIIEEHFNKSLQSILEEVGYLELRQIEQSTIKDMQLRNCVVATGGSAIYGDQGMRYLKNKTVMIFLDVTHPPAGGNPIIVILGSVSFEYLLSPILTGCLIIIVFGILLNKFVAQKKYP